MKKQENKEELPGYKPYLPSEDAYTRLKKESYTEEGEEKEAEKPENEEDKWMELDAMRGGRLKDVDDEIEEENDLTGEDLDIPGAELDDDLEDIGAEDEENNYYSLGGDNHDDLDEREDVL